MRHRPRGRKTAPWIKFSQTYKCYVMAHTAQVLQQTHSHFTGMATVNTRYLCRPPRLRPPEGASILAGSHPSEPLTRIADLPVVRLAPLLYQDQTLIGISHRYNQQIYSRLKHSQVCRWLPDSKCFTLPKVLSRQAVARILQASENQKHRCLVQLLYSGGLGIGEVINLRLTDVQPARNLLLIRGGKGKKDRTTLTFPENFAGAAPIL